jgi:hypothetical protein
MDEDFLREKVPKTESESKFKIKRDTSSPGVPVGFGTGADNMRNQT